MAHKQGHARVAPHLLLVLGMGMILALQVTLLQVAVNRLIWGMYGQVLAPVSGNLVLTLVTWMFYRYGKR